MAEKTSRGPDQSAAPANVATITIPAGQSVSTTLTITTGALQMLISPDDWTPANVSFLVSADNVRFVDLYDMGVEVLRPMGPDRGAVVPAPLTQAVLYLKIRSGPSTNPVPQEADRVFQCVVL